jgi:hypothetical protein
MCLLLLHAAQKMSTLRNRVLSSYPNTDFFSELSPGGVAPCTTRKEAVCCMVVPLYSMGSGLSGVVCVQIQL